MAISCDNSSNYSSFDDYPVYNGSDLGHVYSEENTVFKLWSPAASEVKIHLYKSGDQDDIIDSHSMQKSSDGTWSYKLDGDAKDTYYTFQINQDGRWLEEKPDPYAKAVGVNGLRSMIVDLESTDPIGWDDDVRPTQDAFTDIIIYELHIRDLSINANSGITNKGKYQGLTEKGTKNDSGLATGLDHIKDLGVTHIHLLPTFDHRSIDETRLDEPQYNWGYDPLNYNVPEGSFSSNPYDGNTRIREFKEMVQTLHANGLRVILDVVYNHTGQTEDSNFNQLVPDYYYRQTATGEFSDASACGNETASERAMMRKFIIESVKYWSEEYHIDGFRFDLMGIHDIETMNAVREAVHDIDPTIFVYGEGWTAGDSPLPVEQRALKANTMQTEKVAAFSDDLRDGLKGSVFEHEDRGFVSNKPGTKESIKFGIVASTQHPQVDYSKVNYSNSPWAAEPYQTINYVSCHDNHTLFDKLTISNPEASESELIKMHKLAETIVLTSQGVPFVHAGMEMLRTKEGVENSYNSPDDINQIDWSRKTKYQEVFNYYKQLIQLRKNHPAFRMTSTQDIQDNLEFIETNNEMVIAYRIRNNANGDDWEDILVVLNGGDQDINFNLPEGQWNLVVDGVSVNEGGLRRVSANSVPIPGTTPYIFHKD